MKFGVNVPPFHDARTLVKLAVEAERAGWDGFFLWDHLVHGGEVGRYVHDPWTLLGAIATATERVRLGTMVTPLSRRRPWVVAKQLVTLDHLSGGRAVLGVGLGEPPETDFAAFGDAVDPKERAALLDDGLAVIDGILRGPVEHHGPRFDVVTDMQPLPVQRPRPPIWVAGMAPNSRPRARAARWDGFVPLRDGTPLSPADLREYLAGVDAPAGWDVVASLGPGTPPVDEYADAGATWLIDGVWPVGDWFDELQRRVLAGPPG